MLSDYSAVLIKYNSLEEERSTVQAIAEMSLFHYDVWFTFTSVPITLVLMKKGATADGALVMHGVLSHPSAPAKS